jgi:tRNA threonylcarbamoyl adenosine modification protein YjeE
LDGCYFYLYRPDLPTSYFVSFIFKSLPILNFILSAMASLWVKISNKRFLFALFCTFTDRLISSLSRVEVVCRDVAIDELVRLQPQLLSDILQMEKPFLSSSPEDTRDIAKQFLAGLEKGCTVCLYGNLAAGKSTFSQGLGFELGVKRMTSPTFVIMRQYPVSSHPVIKSLHHLDLYRLESPEDIRSFDLEEIWSDHSNLLLVEWPEKFLDFAEKGLISTCSGYTQREITIIKH